VGKGSVRIPRSERDFVGFIFFAHRILLQQREGDGVRKEVRQREPTPTRFSQQLAAPRFLLVVFKEMSISFPIRRTSAR
jgi:hypothetical protein